MMSEAAAITCQFRPSRVSSEAPEVVQAPEPSHQLSEYRDSFLGPKSPLPKEASSQSTSSSRQEDHEDTALETRSGRQTTYQSSCTGFDQRKSQTRWFILMGVVAGKSFLAGGGIGGSIGTAVRKRNVSTSTVTVTASNSNPTTIVDYAGCPSVNNMTYTTPSTNKQFLKVCGLEIMAEQGQDIDMGKAMKPTFNECLDACAQLEGCVGATWIIFSAADPSRNSVCFFKDGKGRPSSGATSGQQVASGILQP